MDGGGGVRGGTEEGAAGPGRAWLPQSPSRRLKAEVGRSQAGQEGGGPQGKTVVLRPSTPAECTVQSYHPPSQGLCHLSPCV